MIPLLYHRWTWQIKDSVIALDARVPKSFITEIFCPFTSHTTCKSQKLFECLVFIFKLGIQGTKGMLYLFLIIQQATDRALPASQACDTDSRSVTFKIQWWWLPNRAPSICLQHWRDFQPDSWCIAELILKDIRDAKRRWNCNSLLEGVQEQAQTFSRINSPMWCEASICESSTTPLAKPIGILHSEGSTVSLLLKKMRAIPTYILMKSKTASLRTIPSNSVTPLPSQISLN